MLHGPEPHEPIGRSCTSGRRNFPEGWSLCNSSTSGRLFQPTTLAPSKLFPSWNLCLGDRVTAVRIATCDTYRERHSLAVRHSIRGTSRFLQHLSKRSYLEGLVVDDGMLQSLHTWTLFSSSRPTLPSDTLANSDIVSIRS
jgi:hypothetical protein